MASTTWIRNADWIIGYDPQSGGHTYIPNGDLVFSGNQVSFVGRGYGGGADTIVDGTDLMVMPGLMNLHVHSFHELHFKGFFEDLASKHLWMSQLFEYTFLLDWDRGERAGGNRGGALRDVEERLHHRCRTGDVPSAGPRPARHPGQERDARLRQSDGALRRMVRGRRQYRSVSLVR